MNNSLLKKYFFWPEIVNEFNENIDFSKTPISEVVNKLNPESKIIFKKNFESYVFKFYAYNEILTCIRNKNEGVITKEDSIILKDYQNFLNDFSKKIFLYILYCSVSESRNSYLISSDKKTNKYVLEKYISKLIKNSNKYDIDKIHKEKNKSYTDFLTQNIKTSEIPSIDYYEFTNELISTDIKYHYKLFDKSSQNHVFLEYIKFIHSLSHISKDINKHNDYASDIHKNTLFKNKIFDSNFLKTLTISDFLKSSKLYFTKGFDNHLGFGGGSWENIVNHANDFCSGKINTEMFIDKSVSLEHNNGDFFNKNFIFKNIEKEIFLQWINDSGDKFIKFISYKDFILNLQSSSSVLFCLHAKDIEFLSEEKTSLLNKLIHESFPETKNSKEATKVITDMVLDNLKNIKEASTFIYNENKLFIDKIQQYLPDNISFDFVSFLLSFNDRRFKKIEKDIINSKKFNDIFTNLIFSKNNTTINEKHPNSFNLLELYNLTHDEVSKEKIGSKAFSLVVAKDLQLNVPKAINFDTNTCLSYLSNNHFFHESFKISSEKITKFMKNDIGEPILVSVRSGSSISMPGMMDTILNVGIDDTSYNQLCDIYGKKLIDYNAITFIKQFCISSFNIKLKNLNDLDSAILTFKNVLSKNNIVFNTKSKFPLDKETQVKLSVEAVFKSWNSERAKSYREKYNIDYNIGTSATVQKMVFGNKNKKSFTAVIFSRDCISGNKGIIGEYLVKSQGDNLVSGIRTPKPISDLKKENIGIFNEINQISKTLEEHYNEIQDIEITVEDNIVYFLQSRKAVTTKKANLKFAQEKQENLLKYVSVSDIIGKKEVIYNNENKYYIGKSANNGIISGIIVKSEQDISKYSSMKLPLIFFSEQALPEHTPILIKTSGFITKKGGMTSHAAIISRSLNKPCIVGIKNCYVNSGDLVTLDADNSKLWLGLMPLKNNLNESKKITKKILNQYNIYPKEDSFLQLNLIAWNSSFSKSIKRIKYNYTSFLSLHQKLSIVLLKEHKVQLY